MKYQSDLKLTIQICNYHGRAYPVYVNEYASGTQQQYYTTNESFSGTGNNQAETYIVPVEETMIASQSRESPQAISAVSITFEENINCIEYKKLAKEIY